MNLTTDNYYSQEADWAYMSCSQYQSFQECEAKAMAKLEGRWVDDDNKAFIIGNYFHTHFEGPEAHKKFCDDHFEDIYRTKTTKARGFEIVGKYSDYETADKMIAVAERDPLIKALIKMPGEHEKIMTGEIFGVPWRSRLDKYVPDGRVIIDWKTTKNIWETSYNPTLKERETFIETYGYLMRAAVYTEIEKQFSGQDTDAQFIIVAISKQDPPDKEALLLNHRQRYDLELEQIKENLWNITQIKSGSRKPRRCGYCDYCRATKILYQIKPYYKLAPEYREGREEENECNSTGTVLEETPEAGTVEHLPAMPQAAEMAENI